jgi:hypothetical protein
MYQLDTLLLNCLSGGLFYVAVNISCQMVNDSTNYKLEWSRKETVLAKLVYYPGICLE